ncbi:MAG: hypothetical protein N4A71_00320 [Carboxylicivirga sp.]|jgi:hypothetical protein|nr:hypothetical protein [Carboxylicivirga sp.]
MNRFFKLPRFNRSHIRNCIIIGIIIFSSHAVAQAKKDKKEGIKPGKRKAVLILSDGRKIELNATDTLNYSKLEAGKIKCDTLKQKTNKVVVKQKPVVKTKTEVKTSKASS